VAQVYSFVDDNGVTRLLAEIHPDPQPTSGTLLPVADATGVTVDTTTYSDPFHLSAKLTTLVFPAEVSPRSALAIAIAGDAFPRWVMNADGSTGLYFGDGTFDATTGPGFYANSITQGAFNARLIANPAAQANEVAQLGQLSPATTITSGALPTVQLVTATGAQILTTRDAETITPCTFNPGAATTATITVALSPDNLTYSTLGVETVPAGVALDGTVHLVKARVPAGWYLKLTANAQAVLGLTTYY
jgi:hypothetical protein